MRERERKSNYGYDWMMYTEKKKQRGRKIRKAEN
jgi:hypothetical protein